MTWRTFLASAATGAVALVLRYGAGSILRALGWVWPRAEFVVYVDESTALTEAVKIADERLREAADDFAEWETELECRPRIAQHLRSMKRGESR